MLPRIRAGDALFLDVDGTLLDIAPRPDAVSVPPALRRSLAELHGLLGGALALVSGRSIFDIDRLFAPIRLPAAGQHGAELRRSARAPVRHAPVPRGLEALRPVVGRFVAAHPGLLLEDKGLSLCVHYRQAEHWAEPLHRFLVEAAGALAPGLALLPARKAFDLKPRGIDKGAALASFMRRPPFQGRRPVAIGDDRTDEDAFAAALRLGGRAWRVGNRDASIASFGARAPGEIRAWLHASVGWLVERRGWSPDGVGGTLSGDP